MTLAARTRVVAFQQARSLITLPLHSGFGGFAPSARVAYPPGSVVQQVEPEGRQVAAAWPAKRARRSGAFGPVAGGRTAQGVESVSRRCPGPERFLHLARATKR